MGYKMVFSDMDGTLLWKGIRLSVENSEAIRKAVEAAKKLQEKDYTKESFKAVKDARKAAEKVANGAGKTIETRKDEKTMTDMEIRNSRSAQLYPVQKCFANQFLIIFSSFFLQAVSYCRCLHTKSAIANEHRVSPNEDIALAHSSHSFFLPGLAGGDLDYLLFSNLRLLR